MKQAMEKKVVRKMPRSFALWSLGAVIILITGIIVLKNLQHENPSPDERATSSAESRAKPSNRQTANTRPLTPSLNSSSADSNQVTASEETISQIVGSGRPAHDIATDLLQLFPESKGAEQTLVAAHLANLAEGEQLDKLASYLSDPRINKKSKEEIFNAIYDAEPKQVASLLIKVIEDGVQDYTEEAQKGLSILLQADHGTDVAAWRSELDRPENFLEAEIVRE